MERRTQLILSLLILVITTVSSYIIIPTFVEDDTQQTKYQHILLASGSALTMLMNILFTDASPLEVTRDSIGEIVQAGKRK